MLYVCLIGLRHFSAYLGLIERPREREADIEEPGRCPTLFSNEPSGSFTCPVYSTDTWDLGLKYKCFVKQMAEYQAVWTRTRHRGTQCLFRIQAVCQCSVLSKIEKMGHST